MNFEFIPSLWGKIMILLHNTPLSIEWFCLNKCCANPDTLRDLFLLYVHSCKGEKTAATVKQNVTVEEILNISGALMPGTPWQDLFRNVKMKADEYVIMIWKLTC